MKIAILPGDGIGPEIVAQAVRGARRARPDGFETGERAGRRRRPTTRTAIRCPTATLDARARRPTRCCSARSATGSTTRCARAAPRAGDPRPAQGARPVRQPAPGDLLSASSPRASSLKPEVVAGPRHPDHPRADRRHLLRPAARPPHAPDGAFAGADEGFDTMRYTRARDRAHRARRLPGGAQAQQAADQRRQGQRSSTLALSTLVTPLAALARRLEGDVGDALDLGARVAHGVEGFLGAGEGAVGRGAAAARLAEVDVAGELADDQDVEPGDEFGLQARGVGQLRRSRSPGGSWRTGRASCAGRGSPARGATGASSLSYFQSPTAPNSTASAALASLSVASRQRMAVRLVGRAADQGRLRSRT